MKFFVCLRVLCVFVVSLLVVHAQAPRPAFDVATVKRNVSLSANSSQRNMPGGRMRMIVVKRFTEAASAATSVKVIICAQTSARWPGEYPGPDSGGYSNQPRSGVTLNR